VHAITRSAAVLGVALVLCGIGAGYHHATKERMVCHVTGKERVYGMDGQVRAYRLDTRECGVLEVDEVLLYGAWEPDRVYQSIEAGDTYELTTIGWSPIVINAVPHGEVGE
jgi:hypothetical protein